MIYFIQPRDRPFIKIGMTDGPIRERVASLQVASPDELLVLGVMLGGRDVEAEIHEQFDSFRVRGEWFQDAREIRIFIAEYASPLPSTPLHFRYPNCATKRKSRARQVPQ